MIGGLETRVDAQDEILLALDAVKEESKELLQKKADEPSLEAVIEKEQVPDEVRDVLEQELDTESYVKQEYSIHIYEQKSSYEYRNEVEAEGNSASYSIEITEHEILETEQETQQDAKHARVFKEIDLGKFDEGRRHDMTCFKVLYGQTMSFLMYAGELQFN